MSTTPQDRLYDKLLDVANDYCDLLHWTRESGTRIRIADAMHQAAVYETGQIQEQLARQKVLPI